MPFYRFQLQVPLPPDVAQDRIQAITGKPLPYRDSFGTKWGAARRKTPDRPFQGRLEHHRFRLMRHINRRNSFLPLIRGRIDQEPGGSRVSVILHLDPFVAIFMLCWLILVGRTAWPPTGEGLRPAGMFLFGLGITLAGFIPEARKARRLLEAALL
jgi:hypothetical protein